MSDEQAAPNSHGPVQEQMTPEMAARLGLTPTPEGAALTPIPADQVKPEDIGILSIEYQNGEPVVIVSGGKVVPTRLAVAGANGRFATYNIGPLPDGAPNRGDLWGFASFDDFFNR
ncbi:hypothetical protein ACIBSV_29140 [Embleya sp. NPDC050154]|uniref:hypothetical protein n=1 Tax=Embleya sp. NPDC050154 TaxID=3363988 RepID=UPI00379C5B41